MELRLLRSAPATLAGDQLVAPAGKRADDHRLNHPRAGRSTTARSSSACSSKCRAAAARDAARSPPPRRWQGRRRAASALARVSRASSSRPPVDQRLLAARLAEQRAQPLAQLAWGLRRAIRRGPRYSCGFPLLRQAADRARARAPCRRRLPRRRLVVDQRRQPMARRLRQADVARDDRFEHQLAEAFAHVLGDLVGQPVAPVEHRQRDADDAEIGVEPLLHLLDRLQQLAEPSSAKNSHCSGTSSVSAALSALSVNSPSDGGQSMKHTSCARCPRQRRPQPRGAVGHR